MVLKDFQNTELADKIAENLKETTKILTPTSLVDFILLAMKNVEKFFPKEEGSNKKQIVYLAMLKLINSMSDNQIKEPRFIQIMLDNIFDSFVDNVVSVSKNPTDFFNKSKGFFEKIKPLLSGLLSCKRKA